EHGQRFLLEQPEVVQRLIEWLCRNRGAHLIPLSSGFYRGRSDSILQSFQIRGEKRRLLVAPSRQQRRWLAKLRRLENLIAVLVADVQQSSIRPQGGEVAQFPL